MKKYTTLLFDADGTLLDFLADEKSALSRVMALYNIECTEENIKAYSSINQGLWRAFERGEIEKADIQNTRFKEFFKVMGITEDYDFTEINKIYLGFLSEGGRLIPGAKELLLELKQQGYDLSIITNGISSAQRRRLKRADIFELFTHIFVSEAVGHQKPKIEFFDYVLSQIAEKDKSKIIIIVDSLTSDIDGASNAGLNSIWLRQKGEAPCENALPTYIIDDISEVKNYV